MLVHTHAYLASTRVCTHVHKLHRKHQIIFPQNHPMTHLVQNSSTPSGRAIWKADMLNLIKRHYRKDTSGKNFKNSVARTIHGGRWATEPGKAWGCLSFLLAQVHSWGTTTGELGSLEIHHGSLATQDDLLQYFFLLKEQIPPYGSIFFSFFNPVVLHKHFFFLQECKPSSKKNSL